MNKFRYLLYLLTLAVLQACSDRTDFIIDEPDDIIGQGDEVQFAAYVPQVATRSAKDDYDELISRFEHVSDDYVFDIDMWEKGEGDAVKIASATYNPTKNKVGDVTTYDEFGILTEAGNTLFWPSNVKKYGFHAISSNSSSSIETDQTTKKKVFRQDLIEGYGYVPGWDAALNDGEGGAIRKLDDFNYLTAKEWYAANKALGAPKADATTEECVAFWKKIPLYMQHRRSRITVRLKAGEGVERNQIAYDPELNPHNIITEIYSYDAENNRTVISPLLGSYTCEYRTPDALPEEDVKTVCYDAIVNPHNYAEGENLTEQKILAINLSGLKFSFYASNDRSYSSEPDAENNEVKARYNLTPGKHLILEVVLSTDTRKILITAYVVDWEDWPFSSICDDFGQASDPMPINNKTELIEFLTNPEKNKAGNVGVIMPLSFNLIDAVYTEETAKLENDKHLVTDSAGKKPGETGYVTTYEPGYTAVKKGDPIPGAGSGWDPSGYELKATLKLAGATVTTDNRLFDKIAASGSIVNGTVMIADKGGDSPIESAIASENYGMIDRINVRPGNTARKATRAGVVTTNYGTIYACTSQMPVYNPGGESEVLIGGIAAEMLHPMKDDEGVLSPDLSVLPTIDQCNVNARIDGGTNVKGGGIAGKAEGKLSNNTFEYGITLLQDVDRFKNILYVKGGQELNIYDNEWATTAGNSVHNGSDLSNVRPTADLYNQVIDSQEELNKLVSDGTYNNKTCRYRIADSFTVNGDTWSWGKQDLDLSVSGNILCELNCNNKTITLTGTTQAQMLFSNIQSYLYDLTLVLDKPIVALPNATAETDQGKLPARAPLAYAVVGDKAKISNVKVKISNGAYVQSTASGGLVVWAYDGATIEDCQSNVDVRIAQPEASGTQQTYFVGGLVCSAAKATILRCTYQLDHLNATEEANASTASVYYGGIVGGTNIKGTTHPELNISDCASWLTWTTAEQPHAAWGGIIGYSKYQSPLAPDVLITSMDGKCQGNWWAAPAGASPQGWASGMNEEKVIGKKNSLQPLRDINY